MKLYTLKGKTQSSIKFGENNENIALVRAAVNDQRGAHASIVTTESERPTSAIPAFANAARARTRFALYFFSSLLFFEAQKLGAEEPRARSRARLSHVPGRYQFSAWPKPRGWCGPRDALAERAYRARARLRSPPCESKRERRERAHVSREPRRKLKRAPIAIMNSRIPSRIVHCLCSAYFHTVARVSVYVAVCADCPTGRRSVTGFFWQSVDPFPVPCCFSDPPLTGIACLQLGCWTLS